MRVWIENYKDCMCAYVCLFKHDLPGFCAVHSSFSLGTARLENYAGDVGYTEGVPSGGASK